MTEIDPSGRFVWHELMTTDPDAAIRFYPKVTGWGIMPFPENPSYRMWTNNGVALGGVIKIEGSIEMDSPPRWLPYIAVRNVDSSAMEALRLGGMALVKPTDIPMVGRYAVIADPQGATFAIFQSAGTMPGHEGPAQVGEFSWHELMTTDGVAAWKFYSALFGWKETTAMDMGPDGKYQMFGRHGVELGGMYNKPARVTGGPRWLSYVRVKSTNSSVAATTAGGGTLASGPMEVPGGNLIATCEDPQGVAFALHEERERMQAAAKPQAKSKPKAKAKGKAKPRATKPKAAKPKAKAKTKTVKAKAKAKPKTKPKAKSKSKPKARGKK